MSAKLYIDSKLIELGPDTRIGVNKQVNDIAEIQNRQADHTNKFKVPKTLNNMKNLENAHRVDSATNKPYLKLNAKYIQDGVPVIPNGYAIIESADEFYNIAVYSGNADFFDLIEGKKMNDLDLSAYDHTWDLATVIASRLNDSGYIYPIIDFNSDQAYMDNVSRSVDVRTIFAGIYVHTLVQAIIDQTPYTLSGSILSMTKYLKRIFPYNLDRLEYDDATIQANKFNVKRKKTNQTFSIPYQTAAPLGQNVVICNDESSPGYYDNPQTFNTSTGKWTVKQTGKYTFTATTEISLTTGAGFYSIGVIRERAATADTLLDQVVIPMGGNIANAAYTFTTIEVALQKGDIVRLEIGVISANPGLLTVHTGTEFTNTMSRTIQFGGDIYMSQLMPSTMSQKDFLKDIFRQLCIVPVVDSSKYSIEFRQFKEVSQAKPNAIPMDDMMDNSRPPKIKYKFGNYGQKNILKYKDDDKVDAVKYGEGYFLIADETLPLEKVVVESIFSASDDVLRLIDLGVCKIPKLTAGAFANKTGFKMVMLNRQTISPGLVYDDTSNPTQTITTDIPLTYFIDETKQDSMGYDRFLIAYEYAELVQMLQKCKVMEGEFYLKTTQVHKFDHFIPWHSKKWGNYFYVNKISNFQKGKLTAVELIRM